MFVVLSYHHIHENTGHNEASLTTCQWHLLICLSVKRVPDTSVEENYNLGACRITLYSLLSLHMMVEIGYHVKVSAANVKLLSSPQWMDR